MTICKSERMKPIGEKVRVVHYRDIWLPLTETWIFNQIKFLDETIESHVICDRVQNLNQFYLDRIHKLPVAGFFDKLYRFKTKHLNSHPYSRRLLKKVTEICPDIIHSHFGDLAWFEIPIARLLNLVQVVTFYGYDVNRKPRQIPIWQHRYKELFAHVDKVLCEGHHMAEDIVRLGCPKNKVAVHHLGISVEEIPFRPRTWEAGTPLRFLIAGTFVEKKGIPDAIQALGRIKKNLPLEISVIGDANQQPRSIIEKKKILHAIAECGLTQHTRVLGYQAHSVMLKEAYNHHVFLSPSLTAEDGDTEGGVPVSIIEMAATGMPVVSTAHCDIPEVISDGVSGFLAPEKDHVALAGKIKTLIEQKNNWKRFAENARQHIEQEYNARIQGLKLSRVYADMLKRKACGV